MASTIVNRFCLTLYFAFAIATGGAHCHAQSNSGQNDSSDLSPLPKLCKPVSFRYSSATSPIKTSIGMLGDRYSEVTEALRGWNESGVPLVGKFNNEWEAVPCGDDTGLFYIVPLLARRTAWSTDRSLNVFLLGLIAVAAILGMAGLWLTTSGVWGKTLALVSIMMASYLSYKMGDLYVVQGSIVLVLIPWLVYAFKPGVRYRLRFFIMVLSGFILGFSQWLRTQSGSPVLVFFAVLVCFSCLRRSTRALMSAALLICMSLPLLYARLPLRERDRFLALHQSNYQAALNHHLFWHTTYLGLGYLTNPYVAAFRDSVAVEYAETVDPTAIYGGEEYEKLLRSRVLEIVNRDHKFIFYTLAAKAGVLACMLVLLINFGFAAAILRPKPLGTELAFWLALSFAAVPGMVAIPVPQYVLGMVTLALLYWCYSLDNYLHVSGVGAS